VSGVNESKQVKEDAEGGAYLGQTNSLGKKHGKGSYISHEGEIWEGYFKNDAIIYGRKITENGTIEGHFRDWKAHGKCI